MWSEILPAFGLSEKSIEIQAFGTGLINSTWLVKSDNEVFILQRINQHVFKKPQQIADNLSALGSFLNKNFPEYLFIQPCKTLGGADMVVLNGEDHYRLLPFVPNSHTIDVVQSTCQAYEAAKAFGKFTNLLAAFPSRDLHITLPEFHNLSLRYAQFGEALRLGNKARIEEAAELVSFIEANTSIVDTYKAILKNPDFKLRVTHHDTKISNVLLDDNDKGLCVIDLDTVMPGYFISDVGDMFRTYLSPVSEEEADFAKIEIRPEYFEAIYKGYTGELMGELSQAELDHFVYAGKFMIYMQAMRFLTDYINNDVYYGAKYEKHNLVRAGNQVVLLKELMKHEAALLSMIKEVQLQQQ